MLGTILSILIIAGAAVMGLVWLRNRSKVQQKATRPSGGYSGIIPSDLQDYLILEESAEGGKILVAAEQIKEDVQLRNLADALKYTGRIEDVVFLNWQEFKQRAALESARSPSLGSVVSSSTRQIEARDLFSAAAKRGASDIHIDAYTALRSAEIKFRVDGRLVPFATIREDAAKKLMTAIYNTMCGQAETSYSEGKFQDAHISDIAHLPTGVHGIRVISGGQAKGTFMVLRLLYENVSVKGDTIERLIQLGFNELQASMMKHMQARPSGFVLMGGPTGSGKSTTLKHSFETWAKRRSDLLFMTAEDPVEYPIRGVRQIGVPVGYDGTGKDGYAQALRVALRSDPDVLMVGELRDPQSALSALHGAQTGHPVWSTIHANSAWSMLHRLMSLLPQDVIKNPMDYIADPTVMTGMVFQHLVRTLCPECKRPLAGNEKDYDPSVVDRVRKIFRPGTPEYAAICIEGNTHCEACDGVGIAGRTVCAEVVLLDPKMLTEMRTNGVESARDYWLENYKGHTYLDHALTKMKAGEVSPQAIEDRLGPLDLGMILSDRRIDTDELNGLRLTESGFDKALAIAGGA